MSKDEKDAAAGTPKKKLSKKMLIIIIVAVVLLGGGGAGAYLMLAGGEKKVEAPVKGEVVALENPLTVNLADGHYLKVGFALQMTEEAAGAEIDPSQAIDLAIGQYTGLEIGELESENGRSKARDELLEKIEKAYNVDGKHMVMGIYFTQFVTQ
jgi:flagellar FliL protein